MGKSLSRRDYRHYELGSRERVLIGLTVLLAISFLAWFFYRSVWAVLFLAPLGYFMIKHYREQKGQKRRLELMEQFKECILSVSAGMQAGYAVENAFLESREDMKNLYGEDADIYLELEGIRRGLVINIPLEELLLDLGKRSGIAEISQFAQMFSIAKQGGGNLPEMIRTSANLISQKVEARNEVATLLAGRRMEQMIMRLMPFGIGFYVGTSYRDYFAPLYHSLSGAAVMTVCLALYLMAIWLGERIFDGIWKQMDGAGKSGVLIVLQRKGILGKLAPLGEKLYLWVTARFPLTGLLEDTRRNLEQLCQEEPREELLKRYYGGKVALSLLILMVGVTFSVCLRIKEGMNGSAEHTSYLFLGLCGGATVAIFFLMDKDLKDQVQKRRERLRMGYPDLVHRLTLYLVAGLSIRSAFWQIGRSNEMAGYACREMQAGLSEQTAYEHFGKRAGVREYVKLGTLLCQNLKKGTQTLLLRLEEEALLSEESRIQNGKRLGEEAGTKLLIPMVMLLAMIMLMIMVPAFSMMGA